MKGNPISVCIVDDHSVVREGYRRLLERTTDINVVEEADTGEEAYFRSSRIRVDVYIMDINLPGMSGLETLRKIIRRVPDQKILMFSMHEDVVFVSRAMHAGARGYVTKSSAPEVLVDAVRIVASGKLFISQEMAQELALQMRPKNKTKLDLLSAREFEIFRLLVEGHSVSEISELLHLSYKTVANYQSAIKNKLDVSNAAQIIRVGLEHGVISSQLEDSSSS
ncbi:MAG: DNA-binding response regulator [Proteobacteria bacterium]|nr:DNA-binding response regulator [Pseudomonadota bacterium]